MWTRRQFRHSHPSDDAARGRVAVLRDAEVARDRQEHEGVLARKAPLVDQQLRRLLARVLQSLVQVTDGRAVRVERVGGLGDGPATVLLLDYVNLDHADAADLNARPRDLAVRSEERRVGKECRSPWS